MKQFPEGFYWGAATSSFQVEGGIENNDWAEAGRLGKVPVVGIADVHYHRYEEDFDIAKSLNHNAHRFSIEWARIEPEEGKFDEQEIEHYKKVVRALRARGMEPFVNLWHFSLPIWFMKSGSFGHRDAPAIFARYAAKIAGAFGNEARFYITINEPLVWLGEHGKSVGSSPGLWPNPFAYLHFFNQLVRAHKAAYAAIKKAAPASQVGIAKHNFSFVGRGIVGNIFAIKARYLWNRKFLDALRGYQDFIGLQFYQELYFWQSKKEDAAQAKSDIGWQIHPEGIYNALMELKRYNLPLYVSESGIADAKDQYRESFIKKSLEAVHRAITDGAPVKGYLHWSLLDNYEFVEGYAMQFGLVHIDREHNLTRTIRPSARAYAEI